MTVSGDERLTGLFAEEDYQIIMSKTDDDWLGVSSTGHLYLIQGCFRKVVYLIVQFFTCHCEAYIALQNIHVLCSGVLDSLKNDFGVLNSQSESINRHKFTLINFIQKLEPESGDPYLKEQLTEIKEIIEAPEVAEARIALSLGHLPQAVAEGISGTYLMPDRNGEPIGVFKPKVQEAGTEGNPKGYQNMQIQNILNISSQTSYLRERVAYLLDENEFAGIPITTIATLSSRIFQPQMHVPQPLVGSFQIYRNNCRQASKLTSVLPSFLVTPESNKIPAKEVHKMAIFDIRFLNADRHLNNFLVDENYAIHPIDHGFILPGNASYIRYDWVYLSQSQEPFTEEELEYIERIDSDADANILRANWIFEEAIDRMKIATRLLKMAAQEGLTPFEIGQLMLGKNKYGNFLTRTINQFFPILTGVPSYFEASICKKILRDGLEIDNVIEQSISTYLAEKNSY
jgi:hypothetical protein